MRGRQTTTSTCKNARIPRVAETANNGTAKAKYTVAWPLGNEVDVGAMLVTPDGRYGAKKANAGSTIGLARKGRTALSTRARSTAAYKPTSDESSVSRFPRSAAVLPLVANHAPQNNAPRTPPCARSFTDTLHANKSSPRDCRAKPFNSASNHRSTLAAAVMKLVTAGARKRSARSPKIGRLRIPVAIATGENVARDVS